MTIENHLPFLCLLPFSPLPFPLKLSDFASNTSCPCAPPICEIISSSHLLYNSCPSIHLGICTDNIRPSHRSLPRSRTSRVGGSSKYFQNNNIPTIRGDKLFGGEYNQLGLVSASVAGQLVRRPPTTFLWRQQQPSDPWGRGGGHLFPDLDPSTHFLEPPHITLSLGGGGGSHPKTSKIGQTPLVWFHPDLGWVGLTQDPRSAPQVQRPKPTLPISKIHPGVK